MSVSDAPGTRGGAWRRVATRWPLGEGDTPSAERGDDLRQLGRRANPRFGRADIGNRVDWAVRRGARRGRAPFLRGHREADVDLEGQVALDQDMPACLPEVPRRLEISRAVPGGSKAQERLTLPH